MEFKRTEFIKKLNYILNLIKNLKITLEEEPDQLSLNDVHKLTDMIETKLIDTINYAKTN